MVAGGDEVRQGRRGHVHTHVHHLGRDRGGRADHSRIRGKLPNIALMEPSSDKPTKEKKALKTKT